MIRLYVLAVQGLRHSTMEERLDIYDDAVEKLKKKGIDITGKHIITILYGAALDGFAVPGFTKSEDGQWICVPARYDSNYSDTGWEWVPVCYHIDYEAQSYMHTGDMYRLYDILVVSGNVSM